MSLLRKIQTEANKLKREIEKEQKDAEKRNDRLYREMVKKHCKGNNEFYMGVDNFDAVRAEMERSNLETVPCPICLGKKNIRRFVNDITLGFQENKKCPKCQGEGMVFFIYGYKYREVSHDDSERQIW